MPGTKRHLIIVAGQNAVGKSTAIDALLFASKNLSVACEVVPISVYKLLRENVIRDDLRGGKHHTHSWNPEADINTIKKEHAHTNVAVHPIEPFIIAGNTLPDGVSNAHYEALAELPYLENHFWITDILGGINTNTEGTIASLVDYSFQRTNIMLRNGTAPNSWLDAVYAVVHITMEEAKRNELFEKRNNRNREKAEREGNKTDITHVKPHEVFAMYGRDDFSEIKQLFIETGVPFLIEVGNNGTLASYHAELEKISSTLFTKEYLNLCPQK